MSNYQFTSIKRFVVLLAAVSLLSACGGDEVDVRPDDISEIYSRPSVQEENLFVKGAVQSGVVAELDEHTPFLIFVPTNQDFRAYLAEQGVSEEAFIASPNLREFFEAHVIGDAPGLLEQVYEAETGVDATTLSGQTVRLETKEGPYLNPVVVINGRETQDVFNENNLNRSFTILGGPVVDFPAE